MTFGTVNHGGQPSAPAEKKETTQADAYEQMQQQEDQNVRTQERQQNDEIDDANADDAGDDAPLSILLGDDELQDSPSISDDEDQADDTPTVKKLRSVIRDYKGQLKERANTPAAAMIQPAGEFTDPEPQLQDEGIDFDPAKFSEAWKEWNTKKADHEAGQAKRQAKAQEIQSALIEKQTAYGTAKAELIKKVPQFAQAEKVVLDALPPMLQATLLLHSENPTMLVLALGSNKKLRDQMLASQTDLLSLGKMIGTIDAKARLAPRKRNSGEVVPEVKGGGDGSVVANLEAEIAKARKEGDYTQVIRLKAKRKQAQQN